MFLKKLVEGWLGILRCLKWYSVARGYREGLDLCMAKNWYSVAVGDLNPFFGLIGGILFFCVFLL